MLLRLPVWLLVCLFAVTTPLAAQEEPPPLPESEVLTAPDDSQYWRSVRQGERGTVAMPGAANNILIQSEGDNWRAIRNGPYREYSAYILLGMIALLALFFVLRGRMRVESGLTDREVRRFRGHERFGHWLTATSFILLAITGLNIMFGRYLLMPLIGQEAFAAITLWGKVAHNYIAFAFMLGLVWIFVLWVWHNLPDRYDLQWFARAGGMLGGKHPHSRKFNAGQKLIFWVTILGGLSLSISGLQLLFPYTLTFFTSTFSFFNSIFGTELPVNLSVIQEQQFATIWHGIVAIVMTAIIIAHIYIGSIGMQGAFGAMGGGWVDYNWAAEHHDLWLERLERQSNPPIRQSG